MRITVTWLDHVPKPEKKFDVQVTGHRGLWVTVYPSGTKIFRMRYSYQGRRHPWHKIGRYGEENGLTLKRIFQLHADAEMELAEGLNPAVERKRREREAKGKTGGPELRGLLAEWAWLHARKNRKRTWDAIKLFKANIIVPWGKRPIAELNLREATLLLDVLTKRAPVLANRVKALATQVFTYCIGRGLIEINPFLTIPGNPETSRDRWLSADEIRTFWHALDKPENRITRRMALALRLILLTAQRPGEVGGARITEFDLANHLWTIPAARIKTVKLKRKKKGRPAGDVVPPQEHLVPLSQTAVELVTELTELADGRPHLLPSSRSKQQRDRPINDKTISHVLSDLIVVDKSVDPARSTLFGIPPFAPHDLRRTASSHLTGLGVPRNPIVSKLLNHSDGTIDGIYDRHKYLKERRDALDLWDTTLKAMVSEDKS